MSKRTRYSISGAGLAVLAAIALVPAGSAARVSHPLPCAKQVEGRCAVEPRKVVLGDRASVKVKEWENWGSRKAAGTGSFRYDAPAGEESIGPVRGVVLYSRLKGCKKGQRYSHIEVRYGKALKKTLVDVDLAKPCSGR